MKKLSDQQKRETVLILSVGCDRESAVRYIGCSPACLAEAMAHDDAFAVEVGRAEASSEVAHMRNVQKAASDEKYWRASVWWLERHAPERYGRRTPDAVTPQQLEEFLQAVANAVAKCVRDEVDRAQISEAIRRFALGAGVEGGMDETVLALADQDV